MIFIIIIFICVYACVPVRKMSPVCENPQSTGKGSGSFGVRVTGGGEECGLSVGKQTRVLWKDKSS